MNDNFLPSDLDCMPLSNNNFSFDKHKIKQLSKPSGKQLLIAPKILSS